MARRQFEWDNLNGAIRYFSEVGGLPLTDQLLYNNIRHFELLMLSERKELQKIAQLINEGVEFNQQQELEKRLYTALINETTDTARAGRNFEVLSTYNPYFEEGIIAAAAFYRNKDKASLTFDTAVTSWPLSMRCRIFSMNGSSSTTSSRPRTSP